MNDENFYQKKAVPNEAFISLHQNDHQRSSLRFARRIRLPRAVGLGECFSHCVGISLATHNRRLVAVTGGMGVCLAALAWQLASKAEDPLYSEFTNIKTDAILAGMWVGIMGANLLPSTALLMIICINLMGAGGVRLFIAGVVLMVVSCLVTPVNGYSGRV